MEVTEVKIKEERSLQTPLLEDILLEDRDQLWAIINGEKHHYQIFTEKLHQTQLKQLQYYPQEFITECQTTIENELMRLKPGTYTFSIQINDHGVKFFETDPYKTEAKVITLSGEIASLSDPFHRYEEIAFECALCKSLQIIAQNIYETQQKPIACTNPDCKNRRLFHLNHENSKRIVLRWMWVLTKYGPVKVYVNAHNVDELEIGQYVVITGYLKSELKRNNQDWRTIIECDTIQPGVLNTLSEKMDHYTRIYLDPSQGIFLNRSTEEELITETLIRFNELHIKYRYKIEQGPQSENRVIGYIRLNDFITPFYNIGLREILEHLEQYSVSGRHRKQISAIIARYIGQHEDTTEMISRKMGFCEQGWKFPWNSVLLIEEGMQLEEVKKLQKIGANFNGSSEHLRQLYEITEIDHKDLLFAWMFIAPFLSILKDELDIMPILILQGPGDTGKTSFMKLFAYLLGSPFKGGNAINSVSRFEGALASSSLPLFIDDITHANEKIVDILKSYTTAKNRVQKKGGGSGMQFFTVDREMTAPLCFSFNVPPVWINDENFLQRLVLLNMTTTPKKNRKWQMIRNQLRAGELLFLIYSFTKNWQKQELIEYLHDIDENIEKIEITRKRNIYLIFRAGAKLAKDICGLQLDVNPVLSAIDKTRDATFETLDALMRLQVIEGQPKVLNVNEETADLVSYTQEDIYSFVPKSWVKTPLMTAKIQNNFEINEEYWAWNLNNIRELQAQFEGNITKKWRLQDFYDRICKHYPDAKIGRYWTELLKDSIKIKRKISIVAIPKEHFD